MKRASPFIKRLLSFIMAFAMVLSMLPAAAFAVDSDTTVYLKPNSNWLIDNARFAIYCFGNGEKWVGMSDTDNDGYYEGVVPAGYPNIIFCRMNPNTTENNWDNKWNQTSDLTLPTDGTNCYTVADGAWDKGSGSWSVYTPEVEETITVYFRNDWNWTDVSVHYWDDPSKQGTTWPGEKMTLVENVDGKGIYSAKIPAWATGIIFNGIKDEGSGSRDQTPDITGFADGDAYYIHWDGENKVGKFDYTPGGEEPEDPVIPETTYIIAGNNAAVFGTAWDVANTGNKMSLNAETGLYEKTYESVPKGTLAFKVTDGTWDNSWGGSGADGNYEIVLEAISNVTITFNAETKAISHTATHTGEVAEPVNNVIIHYRNTGLWSEVHAYGWLTGTETTVNGGWPGNKLTENAEHKNWYTVELTGLNAPNGIGILFNNGGDSGKTDDITITADGEYWYDGKLLTKAPDTWPDGTVQTVSYSVTMHFADTKNWRGVNLYTWTDFGAPTGSWPGTACELDINDFYTMSFTYEAPEGQGLSFIFNNGGDSGKTVDLKLDNSAFTEVNSVYTAEKWVVPTTANDDGIFYADIGSTREAIAVSPVVKDSYVTFQFKDPSATSVSVAGTLTNWKPKDMIRNDYGVWSFTLRSGYGVNRYKFIVDGDWVMDPQNDWVYTEADGTQNSTFLISNPNADFNDIQIKVHYDAPSPEWNVCAWGAEGLEPQYNFSNGVAKIKLDGRTNQYVAFKVRKSLPGNDWAEQSGEIRINLSTIISGTIDVWVGDNFSVSQTLVGDVVYGNKIKSAELDYDANTITIKTVKSLNDAETAFAIYKNGEPADIIDTITSSGNSYTLTLKETLDLVNLHTYKIAFLEDSNEKYRGGIHTIGTNTVYASDKFAEEFTYDGELGALWSDESTTFRVWAPTAAAVSVKLYKSGTEGTDDLIEAVPMSSGENGTWFTTVDGDLNGTYYTYAVTVDGKTVEVVDPYARTTGVNGKRGMVIDLDSTDPAGWADDQNPNPIKKYSDAIIYELHVRDFSIDDSSGVSESNRGKYLAFTEEGTTTANGVTTGIDYLDELGVTHLHLLPVYDYGSVDETKCDTFNWGYDPVNYNAPEGSYSTDPYNGAVRVNEFKQMVMALHEADISVIMDVVYNHVYDAGKFCMNQIVPKYFSRVNADGSYSNGSGCGNDTASEREMVRKYIVESVLYWHQEYHIDGFRFDLVGLLDATTINQIVEEVHKCCPDVIFYGEGWSMGTAVEPGNGMATQANSAATPNFAYFSDTFRDEVGACKNFDNTVSLGFVSGKTGIEENVANNFRARPWWSNNPQQIVQYVSCHDNYTMVDKLVIALGKSGIDDDVIRMNNLAAAIYMTSQGIPFIHAGEEFLREKLEEDGGRCENSYNASDYVNHIEWSNLEKDTYAANSEYYKGLIEFRKAHEALRMETTAEITENVKYTWVTNEVVMFTIDGAAAGDVSDSIVAIFNANKDDKTVTLPEGCWSVCINATEAGTDVLGTVSGTVSVDGISAMVLVKAPELTDFDYTVDAENGTVILTKYNGTAAAVEVAPMYLVGDTVYSTVLDSTTVFRENTTITSVKIHDGVKFKDNTMTCLFYKCSNLVSADLNGLNTAGVTDMSFMFAECGKLTSVDMTGVDTSSVTTTKAMFSKASKLASIAGYEDWDTSSLEIMYMMFNYVQSMETIDMSKWNLSKIINSGWCFQYCYAKYILLPDNLKTMSAGFLNHARMYEGTTFTIPAGVQKIGYGHTIYDFSDDDFVEFLVAEGNKNYVAIDGILYSADGREMLAVPRGKTFENNTYVIPEGVDFLGELSFSRNYNIHTVVLPNSYEIEYVPACAPRYTVENDGGNLNAGLNVNIAIYLYTGITDYAVKDDNPRYASVDGILYSKDMTTVVAIPTKYDKLMDIPEGVIAWNYEAIWEPAMNKCPGVYIPSTLTEISQDQITKLNTLNKNNASFEINVHTDNPVYGVDEAGNLIVKGVAVARNTATNASYATVSEAMAAAKAGETVIVLADCRESLVVVPAGVTFDLNGFVVEANNVVSFGAVIDTAETVGGIQIDINTTKAFTKLQPENGGYLPIYDTNAGQYKFFKYELINAGAKPVGNSVKFGIQIFFDNVDAYTVLASTKNSGIKLTTKLVWSGMSVPFVDYELSDSSITEYAEQKAAAPTVNYAITLTLHGLDNLSSGNTVSAAPAISTIAEVSAQNDAIVHIVG